VYLAIDRATARRIVELQLAEFAGTSIVEITPAQPTDATTPYHHSVPDILTAQRRNLLIPRFAKPNQVLATAAGAEALGGAGR
jgi:hypothetical protein